MESAAALLTFSFYTFNFLCTATTPLVASKRSAGKEKEALAIGGQALSLALGSTLSLVLIVLKQPLLEVTGTGVSGAEANGYAINFLTVRALAAPAVLYHFSSNRHPLRIPGHQNTNLDSSLRQSGQFCARRCSHRKFPHGPAWSCNRHYNSGMD
jgi:hypothetical protein